MTEAGKTHSGPVRVRFAPSPTGYLHVGGARTALFNWLFARKAGGTMILRIEDTDAERNKPELVSGIIDALKWLGVDWDEGPFYQSQRTQLYREAGKKILASGNAFLCYCPPEKYVGGDHAEDGAEGGKVRRIMRCSCRDGKASTPGTKPAVRFKVPLGGTTKFFDAVFGEREFSNDEIEDFVLLRSGKEGEEFGQAMYQMSVVADDIDMRITHVIRGADHISNTPKQVLLYRALGAEAAGFCARAADSGAGQVATLETPRCDGREYVPPTKGFLPEAFRNFLALLGWAPGGDEEFLRTSELAGEIFARRGEPNERSIRPAEAGVVQHAIPAETANRGACSARGSAAEAGWFVERRVGVRSGWRMVFARPWICCGHACALLPDFSSWSRAFFSDEFPIDEAAKAKFWKDEKVPGLLAKLADALEALPDWNHDACDHASRKVAEDGGVKAGLLINATRVAIVGQAVAPPLFDTMVALGQERVVRRLRDAVRNWK